MKHFTSSEFWALYGELPWEVRELADKSYTLLKTRSGRAPEFSPAPDAALLEAALWIWIGSHAGYDKFTA